jgi:hypothetical protein
MVPKAAKRNRYAELRAIISKAARRVLSSRQSREEQLLKNRALVICAALIAALSTPTSWAPAQGTKDDLEKGFRNPPDSAEQRT